MITVRDTRADSKYWKEFIDEFSNTLLEDRKLYENNEITNISYQSQFWFDHGKYCVRLIFAQYSAGYAINDLQEYFPSFLDAWELSNRLSDEVCAEYDLQSCRDWVFEWTDLAHYNFCFWCIGLALALEMSDQQWKRLLKLIKNEGQDILLDRIIATRQTDRKIGSELLHAKPYARLLRAIDAHEQEQAQLLKEFVQNWYSELARKGKQELWWHVYGDPIKHPLENGSYFGRWCVEAVAAVKAFDLDDSLCLGYKYYPGDLLRPNEPTTHPIRPTSGAPQPKEKKGLLSRWFG